MTGDDNRKTLQSIIASENHSINRVEKLKDFLKQNKEITINKDTFACALRYQKTTKEAFLGVVLGAGVCVAVSLSGGMILGVMIAPVLVASIAVGLAMYFLSQDYEQAKAIEKTISTVSSEISVDGAKRRATTYV